MKPAVHVRCGHFFLLAVFFGLLLGSDSLAPFVRASTSAIVQYSSRGWQTDEGLPQNAVQALAQTRDGYLWVGTSHGLGRFDGVRFTVFDPENTPALEHASITALCQCQDGSLWIGTAGGGLTQLHDGHFAHHRLTDDVRANSVKCIFEGRDRSLWVGTLGGLFHYEKGAWTHFTIKDGLRDNVVRSICESGNRLCIGTGSGLNVWKDGAISVLRKFEDRSVRAVFADSQGNIWLGLTGGLVCLRDGRDTFYSKRDGLPDDNVTAFYEDKRGNLWVGTYGGLCRWVEGKFVLERDSQGGFYDQVNALMEDQEGDIWMGARDGLHELCIKRFASYTRQQGLTHNNVMSVLEDRSGNLWISTWGGGLDRLKDEKITSYTRESGGSDSLGSDLVLSLYEDRDGSILVGTDYEGGTFRFNEGKFTRLWDAGQALTNRVTRVIYRDREGELWFGASPGLVRWNSREKLLEQFTIRCILEDSDGVLWVGTNDGLFRRKDGQFVRLTVPGVLEHDTVIALYEDAEHTLWMGTEGKGLIRNKAGELKAYTTAQGLWSDEIFEILEDDHGWLWMSCPKGVFRVNRRELAAYDRDQGHGITSVAYGKADGMESIQCSGVAKPAAWKSRDGRLWFATTKGVVVTDPNSGLGLNKQPPPVRIEEIVADKQRMEVGMGTGTVRIEPGRGEVEFHYTALSYPVPEKNRFRYRLAGVNPEWVEAGTRRVAYYNNLRPGAYEFEVMGCNNDGVWNTAGAHVAVTLLPHFWQTWWFLGPTAVLGAAGVGGAIRYNTRKRVKQELRRLEQQHAVEKERMRIARDMHDEIGANLTRISFLGALAKRKLDAPEEAGKQIDKMSQTAREMIGALDEIVWAVNPANDTLDHLATYLCRYASEFFENSPIVCQFDIPAQLPHHRLSTDVRHNVFLAVKEALNNALKHANATSLRLQISAQAEVCEIVVWDNGLGFSGSKIPAADGASGPDRGARIGNGLTNMRERLAAIGGQCVVESQPGKGARIVFLVGLNENGKK